MNQTFHDLVKLGTAVLLAVTLSACATRLGRNFDDAYAAQIKPGETTKAEIHGRLGTPALASRAGEEDQWTYAYYEGLGAVSGLGHWFGRVDPSNPNGGQQKRLVVTFKGETVKDAKFTREFPPPYPLEPAYR